MDDKARTKSRPTLRSLTTPGISWPRKVQPRAKGTTAKMRSAVAATTAPVRPKTLVTGHPPSDTVATAAVPACATYP